MGKSSHRGTGKGTIPSVLYHIDSICRARLINPSGPIYSWVSIMGKDRTSIGLYTIDRILKQQIGRPIPAL
tara:strand:- start:256 stop:468 length:213 start_codon:yes stop_codon:yes gene_type:complete